MTDFLTFQTWFVCSFTMFYRRKPSCLDRVYEVRVRWAIFAVLLVLFAAKSLVFSWENFSESYRGTGELPQLIIEARVYLKQGYFVVSHLGHNCWALQSIFRYFEESLLHCPGLDDSLVSRKRERVSEIFHGFLLQVLFSDISSVPAEVWSWNLYAQSFHRLFVSCQPPGLTSWQLQNWNTCWTWGRGSRNRRDHFASERINGI